MAKAYYSTVLDRPAEEIWKIIRDFNNYPVWVEGAGESRIEDGKSGTTVGAIRNVLYQGYRIRQRLLAQSDIERSQTYEFCDAPTLPVTGFQATLRVTPVVDGDRAFVRMVGEFRLRTPPRRRVHRNTADSVRKMAPVTARIDGACVNRVPFRDWSIGRVAALAPISADCEKYRAFRSFR